MTETTKDLVTSDERTLLADVRHNARIWNRDGLRTASDRALVRRQAAQLATLASKLADAAEDGDGDNGDDFDATVIYCQDCGTCVRIPYYDEDDDHGARPRCRLHGDALAKQGRAALPARPSSASPTEVAR